MSQIIPSDRGSENVVTGALQCFLRRNFEDSFLVKKVLDAVPLQQTRE